MTEETLEKLFSKQIIVADHWKLLLTRSASEESEEIDGFVPVGDWMGSTWWEDAGVEANASLEARPSVPEVEAAVSEALGFTVDFRGMNESDTGLHLSFSREVLLPPSMQASPPASKPLPSDRALKAIQAKRREVAISYRRACADKANYKASKASWELARDELEEMIRQSEEEQSLPLVQRMEQPNAQPALPADTSWREVSLEQLGLSEAIRKNLAKVGIETVGTYCDFVAKHGEYWNAEVQGIGISNRTKIEDAIEEFWAKRKEQGLSTPDSVVKEAADALEVPECNDEDEEAE